MSTPRPEEHTAARQDATLRHAAARHELVEQLRPQLLPAIDVLHVTAVLQSSGINDEQAHARYGAQDVFHLAEIIWLTEDLGLDRQPRPSVITSAPDNAASGPTLSRVLHGPIYLLPAVAMPALLVVVGPTWSVQTLVTAGAVGWVCAALIAWWGFTLRSANRPARADRDARRLLLLCSALGSGLCLLLVLFGVPASVGWVLAVLLVYQLTSLALFFLRRRRWLVLAAAPAVTTLVLVLAGADRQAMVRWTAASFAITTILLLLLTLTVVSPPSAGPDGDLRPLAVPWGGAARTFGHAVAAATFLLVAQADFLRQRLDVATGIGALIIVMGYVEWRAVVIADQDRAALREASSITALRRTVRQRGAREGAGVAIVTGLVAALLATGFAVADLLTPAGVLVLATCVPLAVAYLLALVLANCGALVGVAAGFAGAVAVELGLFTVLDLPMTHAFAAASLALLAGLAVLFLAQPARAFR